MNQWIEKRYMGSGEAADPEARTKAGAAGSCVGVGVNVLLAGVKLIVGVITGSVAIVADAANNFGDALSSLVSLVTIHLAGKAPDPEHPFGHGRMEYIGALGVSMLILLMGIELLKSAAESILSPAVPAFGAVPVLIMLLSIGGKLWLFRFYRRLGARIDSAPLLAAAKDSLGDVAATGAVVLSMLVGLIFGLAIDGWMGLAVALLVLKVGIEVFRDTLNSLLGGNTNPELGRQILSILEGYDQVLGTHDLMIHDYGPGRCVASVHAEVPADGNILDLHEMIDRAEQEISSTLHLPICIHMDPIVTGDPDTDRMHHALSAHLAATHPGFSLHDLRRVPGQERVNIVFDVAVPAGFSGQTALAAELETAAQSVDPRARCVIHFDVDVYHDPNTGGT